MSTNDRNEQFKGFARLLLEELKECGATPKFLSAYYAEQAEQIIAQRAYDLIYSIAEHAYTSRGLPPMVGEIHQTVKMVPDLTEWPES